MGIIHDLRPGHRTTLQMRLANVRRRDLIQFQYYSHKAVGQVVRVVTQCDAAGYREIELEGVENRERLRERR
jgi:hypothetical protein